MKTINIGRNPNNDVVIDDNFVSSRHCNILFENGKYTITDLNSTNGVFVNGKRITTCELSTTDTVKIGNTLLDWLSYFVEQPISKVPHFNLDIARKLSIGRTPSNNIVIDDELVSANHALLYETSQGEIFIKDLDSANGIFVNDKRVTKAQLYKGDSVKISKYPIDWYGYMNTEIKKPLIPKTTLSFIITILIALIVFTIVIWSLKFFLFDKTKAQTETSQENKLSKLVEETEKSVFLVEAFDEKNELVGTGTGFFVKENGIAVSNLHVMTMGTRYIIKTYDGQIHHLKKILYEQEKYDFIVFSLDNVKQTHYPVLKFFAENKPEKGDDIFVVGNPKGIESTLTKGIISAIRDVGQEKDSFKDGDSYIQIDAAISPGSSGSPVMNMNGEVVGIVTLKIMDCENCNFALSAKILKQFIKQ